MIVYRARSGHTQQERNIRLSAQDAVVSFLGERTLSPATPDLRCNISLATPTGKCFFSRDFATRRTLCVSTCGKIRCQLPSVWKDSLAVAGAIRTQTRCGKLANSSGRSTTWNCELNFLFFNVNMSTHCSVLSFRAQCGNLSSNIQNMVARIPNILSILP